MTESVATPGEQDDENLLQLSRAGDTAAFSALSARHSGAALRLAGLLGASSAQADDIVTAVFDRLHELIRSGGGPSNAVRPFVLARVAHACEQLGGPAAAGPELAALENTLTARAYLSLPQRWQAALWHAEIEHTPQAEASVILGLSGSGIQALSRRAADALRQAYLRGYAGHATRAACRPVAERLGAYLRHDLAGRDAELVSGHLARCEECSAVLQDASAILHCLRADVAPLILGPAAASYLASAGDNWTAAAGYGPEGDWADQRPPRRRAGAWRPSRVLLAAGAAVVVVAGGTVAVALASNRSPAPSVRRVPAAAVQATGGQDASSPDRPATSAAPSPTPPPSPAPPPSPTAASPAASRSPAPPASPDPAPTSPTPPPAAKLGSSVSVSKRGLLSFTVKNSGSASSGTLTAQITLPSGTMGGVMGSGNNGGWTCQQSKGGATCTHPALAAGQSASGSLRVGLGLGPGCDGTVELQVSDSLGESAPPSSGSC